MGLACWHVGMVWVLLAVLAWHSMSSCHYPLSLLTLACSSMLVSWCLPTSWFTGMGVGAMAGSHHHGTMCLLVIIDYLLGQHCRIS